MKREEMVQWLEWAELSQQMLRDVSSLIEALEMTGIEESGDSETVSQLAERLPAALKDLKNMPVPQDRECKKLKKLFTRIIKTQIKGLKVIAKQSSPEIAVQLFWEDLLRDSRYTLTSLQIKYQCYPEWMKRQREGDTGEGV